MGQNLAPVREMLPQQKPRTSGMAFGPGGRWEVGGLEEAVGAGMTATRRRSRDSVGAGKPPPRAAVVEARLRRGGTREMCPASSLL